MPDLPIRLIRSASEETGTPGHGAGRQQWVVVMEDESLKETAHNNGRTQYQLVLQEKIADMLVERHDQNGVLFDMFFSNPDFKAGLLSYLLGTYDEHRRERAG